MVLDAVEMARRARGGRPSPVGLVAHSDAGSQYISVRFGERLAEIGARTLSIGTVADSYVNALAETTNRLLQGRVRRRARHRRLGRHRPPRAGHPRLGPLVQPRPPPQPLRIRPPSRARGNVLRCPTDRPPRDWNPITRASKHPRVVQSCGFRIISKNGQKRVSPSFLPTVFGRRTRPPGNRPRSSGVIHSDGGDVPTSFRHPYRRVVVRLEGRTRCPVSSTLLWPS